MVKWSVTFYDEFDSEFDALLEAVQGEMLAHARLSNGVDSLWRPKYSGTVHLSREWLNMSSQRVRDACPVTRVR